MKSRADQIKDELSKLTPDERRAVFAWLRQEFTIHPIEIQLNARAEIILEAIHRATDLSLRGVRGLIAEASFDALALPGWKKQPIHGDQPYDFLLSDGRGEVRVQVKLQRLEKKIPKLAKRAWQAPGKTTYVVETQKTRSGAAAATGEATRPYRYGEFDLLAVSMQPSTGDWSRFMFTVSRWLIPRRDNPSCMLTFQPVSSEPDEHWTDSFDVAAGWYRSGVDRRLRD